MLTELHVADLGIVADLTLVLGRGLTAITGETGAGKTLLVEAVELLVGGRADTTLGARRRRRGAGRRSIRRRRHRRRGRAGARRAAGRPQPCLRRRAARDRRRARRGGYAVSWTFMASTRINRSSRRRCSVPRSTGSSARRQPIPSPRTAPPEPRCDASTPSSPGSAATIGPVRASSTCCGSRSTRSRPPASTMRVRTSPSKPRRRCSPTRRRTAKPWRRRTAPSRARRSMRSARLRRRWRAEVRSPSSPSGSAPHKPSWPSWGVSYASHATRWSDDPQRLEEIRAAAKAPARAHAEVRRDPRGRARVRRRHPPAARGARGVRGACHRAGTSAARRYVRRPSRRLPRCPGLGRPERAPSPRPSRRTSGSSRCRQPPSRSSWSRGSRPTTAPTGSCSSSPPTPGSRPGPSARSRRAVSSPRDAGRAAWCSPRRRPRWCSTRSTPASGVRREPRSGRLLADLAGAHQVLVVTHLAQVAAYADAQVVVEKREQGKRTVASAETVAGEERVRELSRDAGGGRRVRARPQPCRRAARRRVRASSGRGLMARRSTACGRRPSPGPARDRPPDQGSREASPAGRHRRDQPP